jgi:hypothetical protein
MAGRPLTLKNRVQRYDKKMNCVHFFSKILKKCEKVLDNSRKSSNFAPVQWNEGLSEAPHFHLNIEIEDD